MSIFIQHTINIANLLFLYYMKMHLYRCSFTGLPLGLCRYDEQHIDSPPSGNSYDNNIY